MRRRVLSDEQKLCILQLVFEKKAILFGKFSNKPEKSLTYADKRREWQNIVEECRTRHRFDPLPDGKDSTYMSSTMWDNWRSDTVKKRERLMASGVAGDDESQYTDVENLVLDIIGRDPPQVAGWNVPEQWDNGLGVPARARQKRPPPSPSSEASDAAEGLSDLITPVGDSPVRRLRSKNSRANTVASRRVTRSTNAQQHWRRTHAEQLQQDADKRRNVQLQNELMEAQIEYLKTKTEFVRMQIEKFSNP